MLTITDDQTDESLINFTTDVYNKIWHTSHDYRITEPVYFESKKISNKIMLDAQFMAIAIYISFLTDKMLEFDFTAIEQFTGTEILEWDKKGGLCIYLSVLHYCLLLETRIVKEEDLKFIQGFYSHPSHGIMSIFANCITQSGLHAFITVENAIVDFSIKQEACVFNFEDGNEFIMGRIPYEMMLGGWIEGKQIAKKYAREIAKVSGINYFEWIDKHMIYAYEIGLKELRENSKIMENKIHDY